MGIFIVRAGERASEGSGAGRVCRHPNRRLPTDPCRSRRDGGHGPDGRLERLVPPSHKDINSTPAARRGGVVRQHPHVQEDARAVFGVYGRSRKRLLLRDPVHQRRNAIFGSAGLSAGLSIRNADVPFGEFTLAHSSSALQIKRIFPQKLICQKRIFVVEYSTDSYYMVPVRVNFPDVGSDFQNGCLSLSQ